ncbi:quinone-dependent dihydroorotate dehydrogenase [Pelagibacterium lacus]|uniref:Dihydroorotate dehydrogenase (quinone) n=1 Tax=Pelagibacterium lacus TaxID=2282655 RepID=A0A369W3I8_9HYPH|nr:quinone-dependent dihydroorotate dehydrogenase [Pelagibacterium lacus]RDE08903.1 quinone-dependent dihydroorotate dehydrogenase [Pelagibacterium lacus]
MALGDLLRHATLQKFARDSLLRMEAETAHKATLNALKFGLVPAGAADPANLATRFLGLDLSNPIGMAAGFDKNAEVPDPLMRMGLGCVEIGTVTPLPQRGNPAPRVFRLPQSMGVINRMGFNNDGHDAVARRLAGRAPGGVVGVNIGANRDSADFVADFVKGVVAFSPLADYLTVNVSSPNTPGLRNFQAEDALRRLLGAVTEARAGQGRQTPILLKIAPDLDEPQMDDIARIVLASGIDGLIVSNTTIARDAVAGQENATEAGGLSGRPLFALATRRLAQMRLRLGPDFPIIGVGGVHSARSAIAKFEAGANVVQLYSALVFGGLEMIEEIKSGLSQAIAAQGLGSVSGLTGTAVADWAEGRGAL